MSSRLRSHSKMSNVRWDDDPKFAVSGQSHPPPDDTRHCLLTSDDKMPRHLASRYKASVTTFFWCGDHNPHRDMTGQCWGRWRYDNNGLFSNTQKWTRKISPALCSLLRRECAVRTSSWQGLLTRHTCCQAELDVTNVRSLCLLRPSFVSESGLLGGLHWASLRCSHNSHSDRKSKSWQPGREMPN